MTSIKLVAARPAFFNDPTRACNGADRALFFPDQAHNAEKAKAICRRCPFRSDCLDYAIGIYDLYGVWGATTFQDRIAIRKRRREVGR